MNYRIGLVGTGRLGTAFAGELLRRGHNIAAVVSREPLRAREWALRYGTVVVPENQIMMETDLLILATPDDVLGDTVNALSSFSGGWHGKIVVHTSGSLGSSVLAPLEQAGAFIGSMHPLCSFAGEPRIPQGIYFGIEGSAPACQAAQELVEFLAGYPLNLEPDAKTLYHAAACMAANYAVALADAAGQTMAAAGLPIDLATQALMPLMAGVIENIRLRGTEGALTGPIIRGDAKTVQRHLQTLEERLPKTLPLYRFLAQHTLDLANRAGLCEEKREAIETTLNQRAIGAMDVKE